MSTTASRLALLCLASWLAACAAPPPRPASEDPILVLQPVRLARLDDQRARYRQLFCRQLAAPWNAPCTTYLRRFDDEPDVPANTAQPAGPTVPVNVFVVSGVFGECFPGLVVFGDARAAIAGNMLQFFDVPVHGRGSTELNAPLVRDFILGQLAQQTGPHRNIIVSYSKGTADTLAALAGSGALAARIDALLSVAGAVNGSPLADAYEDVYASIAAALPLSACKTTDRGELASLNSQVRLAWLAAHPLPTHPRYFSLVAAPTEERVSAALRSFFHKLAWVDARNDGQLLAQDAVVPGSTILGYVNADHFAVALPLLAWHPALFSVLAKPNDFPRQQMLAAALAFIEQDLATAPSVAPK